MKKDEFVALGVDEELAKKLEEASAEELKNFIPKSRFDEVNNAKKTLENDLKERDGQLETLKKSSGDAEALKDQITKLQEENKQASVAHAAEVKQLKIEAAVEAALSGAKAKNQKAVIPFLALENADLNDDGTVKGLEDQIKALKKDAKTSFLFDNDAPKITGVNVNDPNRGNPGTITRKEFDRMSYSERVNLFNADPNLYQSLTTTADTK